MCTIDHYSVSIQLSCRDIKNLIRVEFGELVNWQRSMIQRVAARWQTEEIRRF